MRPSTGIYGVLGVLIVVWGSTWSAIRISLEGIPPFTGVALRFALAGVVLTLMGGLAGIPGEVDRRLLRVWAIELIFGIVISYTVVYWATQRGVPTGLEAVLFSTFAIFVAVIAHFWLDGEPMHRRALVGLVLGVAGIAVIYSEDLRALAGPGVPLASMVLLVSAFSAAISHVAIKKWGDGIDPMRLATAPMLATGLIMGVAAWVLERDQTVVLRGRPLWALLYLALMGSVVTFTLYYWLLQRLPATKLSLITFGFPIVALGIGTVLFDEPWTARTFVGSSLVVFGVALASVVGASGVKPKGASLDDGTAPER